MEDLVYNIEDPSIFYKNYDKNKNITSPILSKYEKTIVLYNRIQLISNGSIPLIDNPDEFDSIYEIVEEKLKKKKIPFILKRKIGDTFEYWKLEDLIIN